MTRREALQIAGVAALPWSAGGAARTHALAGFVTASMAIDDVRRLLALDTRGRKELRSAVLKDGEAARLGAGLPKPSGPLSGTPAEMAAGAGALIAHTVMPMLSVAPDAIALDAALLAARRPGAKPLPKAVYLEYLQAIDLRCQIELHTLAPEDNDVHSWLEGTAQWFQETRSYMDALATALAAGASSPAFEAGDPLFRLAERVRLAEGVTARDFEFAKPSSTYGKALAAALEAIAKA